MGSVRWSIVALTVAAASAALGQDAQQPKSKRENVVTPEAKAVMTVFRKLVYRPAEHGLSTMKGEVVAAAFPSRPRATFEFAAPRWFKTTAPPGFDDEKRGLGLTGNLFDFPLSTALDPSDVFADRECDADVVEKDGKRLLRLNAFRDGTPTGRSEFEIDASGIVIRHVWRGPRDDSRGNYAVRYVWQTCGDLRRVSAMEVTFEGPGAPHYACAFQYVDVSGVHVVSSYEMTYFSKGRAPRTFAFHVDGLEVNGSRVELPTPWKRANRISPEAKAVIERFAELVDRPADHGFSSARGVVMPLELDLQASATRVLVSARARDAVPSRATLESAFRLDLTFAILGVPLSFSPEFDADLSETDGTRTLVATEYREGAAACRTETKFDATGLPFAMRAAGLPTGSPATEYRFKWSKSGVRWRLTEFEVWDVAMNVHVKTAFDYVDVADTFVPRLLRKSYAGGVLDGKTVEFVIEDLVVNGTKVETSEDATAEPK